ncbi:beta-glucosidase H [Streptomyces sp. NBC_01022]|uniref:beta-glucosidase H n=1 Tax=Streptomyces sp. NBC_01022 TaxID=2903723 RepID=UPI002DD82ECE|nr:glycoside hydrolase family 3 C-terminal domain-containing protein [Streptomyces sp. NBC_01022]WRZ85600.1 glycoside hydrolase family 3 C-terminal domain-containing protein [Streptomyces sp. NBC_01022]
MNRRTFLSAAVLTALASGIAPAAAAPRRTADTAPDSRAVALLARMTAAQKEALVRCDFAALSSLGIPALTMVDASAGLRGETGVTAFPVPLAQAATFDADLAGRLGTALGTEGRAKGYNNLLGPTVDTARTWHFGRQAEGMGEDPLLAGTLGAALTRGIQEQHVVATVKHFSAYTQEVNRFFVDAQLSDRALHEIYHAAFERIIATVPVTSVMMAYPKINGTFATQSPALFNDLKKTIGLEGYTVPDFWAGDDPVGAVKAGMDLGGLGPGGVKIPVGGLVDGSVPTARLDDAALRILNTMYVNGLFDHPVPAPAADVSTQAHKDLAHALAVNSAVLLTNRGQALPLTSTIKSLAVIGPAGDTALTGVSGSSYVTPGAWITPLAAIKDRAGAGVTVTYREGSVGDIPLTAVPATVLRTASGAAGLTGSFYAAAEPSGTPVATQVSAGVDFTSAPVAGLPAVWSARWSGTLTPTTTGLHRFSLLPSGTTKLVINGKTVISGTRHSRRFFLGPYDYPLQGTIDLTAGKAVSVSIDYSNSTADTGTCGLTLGWQPTSLIPEAVAAARAGDAAVVIVNRVAGEDMDHGSLDLPGDQNKLIADVAAANPRTIVVLNTDGPVAMPWINDVEAVVQLWYAGRATGTALAAILFGDADPSGRLPVTFPVTASQGPGATLATYPGNGPTVSHSEGHLVGYRYYDAKNQSPLFPFGHGLSYTTFNLGSLETSYNTAAKTLAAAVTLTNSGSRAGTEVVQLYAGLPAGAQAEPRRLIGFRKVTLAPGASTRITFSVSARDLSVWTASAWKLTPGSYTVHAGRSSRSLAVQRVVTIS